MNNHDEYMTNHVGITFDEPAIIQSLKRTYPFLYEDMKSYEVVTDYDMYIKMKDGSTVLYDDFDRSFRQLPHNRDMLTEEQCRLEFAYRLYRIMQRSNVTQQELSDMTGIHQPQISSYITAKSLPSFYNADKIAKALGCSVDEFRYC